MSFTRMTEKQRKKFESYCENLRGEKLHDEVPQAKIFKELIKKRKVLW